MKTIDKILLFVPFFGVYYMFSPLMKKTYMQNTDKENVILPVLIQGIYFWGTVFYLLSLIK